MRLQVKSARKKFSIHFTVATQQPQRIRILAYDAARQGTKYTDRYVKLAGQRDFEIRLPLSPNELIVQVLSDYDDRSLKCFGVKYDKLKTCDVWTDWRTRRFINFAAEFSEKASYLNPGKYHTNDGEFTIIYSPAILDDKNRSMNTPARIGHTTGNIEISREKFLSMTVPARMIILLHEYSHKWMNPQIGRGINDETAADINALYIYLGYGFPHIDARTVFANVFYVTQNEANTKRLNIIEDYITKFENGEIKGCK